jgi:hypothetical protein
MLLVLTQPALMLALMLNKANIDGLTLLDLMLPKDNDEDLGFGDAGWYC